MPLPDYVLNLVAGIERHASDYTPDEYGEADQTFSTVAVDETFAINVQVLNAEKRAMLGSTGIDITHRGYMNPWTGMEFTEKDRLRVSTSAANVIAGTGEVYYINFINDPANLGHHWELDLVSSRDGGE